MSVCINFTFIHFFVRCDIYKLLIIICVMYADFHKNKYHLGTFLYSILVKPGGNM